MKIIPVRLIIQLILAMALFVPAISFSDQTDSRLDALFTTLKSSENSVELQQTEVNIWAIWFESGRAEIDSLMEKAGIAVQSSQLAQAEKRGGPAHETPGGLSEKRTLYPHGGKRQVQDHRGDLAASGLFKRYDKDV